MNRIVLFGIISWLPLAVAITGLSGLIYLAVQQDMRQSANDPQIQIAEDAAVLLTNGVSPAEIVPSGKAVDIAVSLFPWVAVYNSSGTPLGSSGLLNNAPPKLPVGLFDTTSWGGFFGSKTYTTAGGEETRVTWQPDPSVRQALVLVATKDGNFVASGRSLSVVEEREDTLTRNVFLAWAVTMFGSLIFALLSVFLRERYLKSKSKPEVV